ncbi:MAG: sulfatase-like hydrolase/transferase [Caldilineaceae bacterium]
MPTRPNLLYIHTDQHSPFVTGCYGDPLVQTPNLDRLAAEGVVFDNVYCASPICVPSRMSMLTGRYPYQNEVWTNEHVLDSGIPTLAHAMGAAGYRPALAGRMHSLGPDQLHGYAERMVGDHSSNFVGGAGPDRGVLNGTAGPHRISLQRSGPGQSAYQVHDEYVTASAIDFLNREAACRRALRAYDEVEPFNLTVGYMLPHAPFVARRKEYEYYAARMRPPRNPSIPRDDHAHLRWWRAYAEIEDVTVEEALRARSAYWALVGTVDTMVGEILTALHENGLADNTLVVYTSDHGEMVGEHGLWWKHVFYEESVKVPLIMSWPGLIPTGQRCPRVVSALDVGATILEALGAPRLPNGVGRSTLGLIDGSADPPKWEDVAFSEYCSDEFCPDGGCFQRMVRWNEWKLIYYHSQPPQLFNLREDPGELRDRAADIECREVVETLTALVLDGWDPDWVRSKMEAKKADVALLRDWASRTNPLETYRWAMRPEMSYLDEKDEEE